MQGHIFLEIYIKDTWYLYDPTFHILYFDYDYDNIFLPRGYIAFAKALNSHEIGVHSTQDEKQIGIEYAKSFCISEYKNPNYNMIDIRKIVPDKRLK